MLSCSSLDMMDEFDWPPEQTAGLSIPQSAAPPQTGQSAQQPASRPPEQTPQTTQPPSQSQPAVRPPEQTTQTTQLPVQSQPASDLPPPQTAINEDSAGTYELVINPEATDLNETPEIVQTESQTPDSSDVPFLSLNEDTPSPPAETISPIITWVQPQTQQSPALPRVPPPQTLPPEQEQPANQTPVMQTAEPPPVQPEQTQPAQTQPAQTQPAQTQPAQTQPAQTQPPTAPAQTQPAPQPAQTAMITPSPAVESINEKDELSRNDPYSNLPQSPASGIESLTQMGMTPQDSDIMFSRVVRATAGQILEIPFRGNGWVFLGELASRRGIVYNSRRNDTDGQSFIFSLDEAGTYILKFYRQDFIRDYIINDHVQVIVGDAPAASAGWFNEPVDRGRVIAQPRWPSAIEEAILQSGQWPGTEPFYSGAVQEETASSLSAFTPEQGQAVSSSLTLETQPSAAAQTASPNADSSAPADRPPPDVLLQGARDSFNRGNVAAAISSLNQYMDYYPGGSDEVYWLMGQFYEANSPDRNILLSLEYYNRLINEYPQSSRFTEARSRIAYLERFYINIR